MAFRFVLTIGLTMLSVHPLHPQLLDMKLFENMKARSIGPAGMSGRVTAIDVVLKNPNIIYAGTASGGLWRSTSGGIAWEPIFDTLKAAAIGAVAVDQRNPDVIWVGTGEGNPRNSQNSGNGVYKSLDGGRTWKHLGLDGTQNIHRLVIDPHNPDVVYVGAQGAAWGENRERGVYKTTDGGRTWKHVLYVDTKTGVGDLVMDPVNPNKLIAAMWEYRRWPWFFKSGGPGSGLYVTFDGGNTWTKRTEKDGLPSGELGRIGVAIARSQPNVVYALVESKKNALYRSEDGGFTWKMVADKNIGGRPFYYAEIYVDPKNENRVYNLHTLVTMSEDGGKMFEVLIPFHRVHPDHHAWWIHPDDPDFIIDGNDGGLAISRDRGRTWRFVENLPLAQFYHINVDMDVPYNVYGGMQDNGSWRGPSTVWRAGGIRNSYWEEVAFGDGFDVVPDRSDSRYGYAMSQGGNLYRYDLATGETRLIKPQHPDGVRLRFNWNAGLAHDPFSTTTIYYGSQFVHKSTDRGHTWQIISPDLTTNDTTKQRQIESGGLTYDVTAAENHCTILAIAPSPVQAGVIWAGTDDGNVQLTQNGGRTWTNVVRNIKGVPDSTWITQIQASTYSAGEAFVVFDNHRRNDWTPYVFHTTDYGRSWRRLVDEKSVWGYALAVAQDPVEPRLLFLGTEFGLYVSIDLGRTWTKWLPGYPTVSTMDLVIHPREHDLVVGTFGRAAYILDDIRPLRALARHGITLLEKPLTLFEIPDAIIARYKQAAGTRFAAEAEFAGQNRPYGALVTYAARIDTAKASLKDTAVARTDSVKIEILDARGEVIRTWREKAVNGMNRTTWSLNRRGERSPHQEKPEPGAPEPPGPSVLAGTYKVRVTFGKHVDSAEVQVKFDPRYDIPEVDIKARYAMIEELLSRIRLTTEAADRLREARKTVDQITGLIKERDDEDAKKVKAKGKTAQDSIKALIEMINQREVQGIRSDPTLLGSRLSQANWYLQSSWEAPGETERIVFSQATGVLQGILTAINGFFERDWASYRETVDAARITFFKEYEPLRMEEE
jgi:photosystem II stability/assembly factor-like uncharacterized protein